MLVPNARIKLSHKVGDDTPDEYGVPTSRLEWSELITCQKQVVRDDVRGRYSDGHFRQSLYRVHLPIADAPVWIEESTQAELFTDGGKSLGGYSVQSVAKAYLLNHYEVELGEPYGV